MTDGRSRNGGWRGNSNSLDNLKRGHPVGRAMPGSKTPARTSSVVVRELFSIIDATEMSASDIAYPAGIHTVTLTHWKHGKSSPRLTDFENVAANLGYRIALVPIDIDL